MKNKGIIAALTAALAFLTPAYAIKALNRPVQYVQPDGSVIEIINHGDEFHHWATDASGRVLTLSEDGFWRIGTKAATIPAPAASQRRLQASAAIADRAKSPIAQGKHKFLVILVQFSDLKFTVSGPNQAFTDLLNKPGYSKNGGTGSAYDYYSENSNERFDPSFDVFGPYTVSQGYASYGGNDRYGNDKNPDGAFFEACQLANSEIDFSDYDLDSDGYVDNIFFYYAGYNEAEGAPANTIWPHQWGFYNYQSQSFDGVRLDTYACTSEYRGTSGKVMCGIGTFCHEFGHVLGLPDFYDTDYEDNGSNDDPLGVYSTMDSGSYLNDGCTPPYFSAMERSIIGWIAEPDEISGDGTKTLSPVHEDDAFKYTSPNSGEYFILECRDNTGWDVCLPGGLLVYHVDKSSNKVSGRITASSLWTSGDNMINAYEGHPCYYLVKASSRADNMDSYYYAYTPFPGKSNVKNYTPVMWSKESCALSLSEISYSGGMVIFKASGIASEEDWGNGDDIKIRELGYSYIRPDGKGGYEVVPGIGLTIKSLEWQISAENVCATVTYTDGSTDIIEMEFISDIPL